MQANPIVISVMPCYNSCCGFVISVVISKRPYNNKILYEKLVCGCNN